MGLIGFGLPLPAEIFRMAFERITGDETFPRTTRERLSQLAVFSVDIEYRQLEDGNWCVRTISKGDELRFAAIARSLDKALDRLNVFLLIYTKK